MATERLSMRQTREILRQKWHLRRTHREVAASLGIPPAADDSVRVREVRALVEDPRGRLPGLRRPRDGAGTRRGKA